MLDKETSKSSKNIDTPGEGNSENASSDGARIIDTFKGASSETETVVVNTFASHNDGGDIGDDASNKAAGNDYLMRFSSDVNREHDNVNHRLSIIRLCDDPSTSAVRQSPINNSNNDLEQIQLSKCVINREKNSPTNTSQYTETVSRVEPSMHASSNEIPLTCINQYMEKDYIHTVRRPTISVKSFSAVLGRQVDNEIYPSSSPKRNDGIEQRNQSQCDIMAGSQMLNRNNKKISFSIPTQNDVRMASRSFSPAEIIDLSSISETRCESPANSSVTTASTSRPVGGKPMADQSVSYMRHVRRAPKEPEDYIDALFPHIRETHLRIRQALLHSPLTDVKDGALLKHKMIDVIQFYTRGCKNEFERAANSAILCRRLKRNIIRLLDLFNEICHSSRQEPLYLYHISQLIAVYSSLEIRFSLNLSRLQKCALIHRLAYVIKKHLIVYDESLAKENVLRMFLHMPDMYSSRFVLEPLFNTFLPEIFTSSKTQEQRELPDKKFVQYIIILYQWKEMLRDPFEQVELINKAQHFMCPTKTLHSNTIYENHLPTIHTRKNAVKDILNNLKFFHDLKNASICDDSLQNVDGDVIVVFNEDLDIPLWDFGATYSAESNYRMHKIQSRKIASQPVECVDLTQEEDDNEPAREEKMENHLIWLTLLKQKASESVITDESENVICLDSDSDGELFSGSIIDPSESYQNCDGFDTDYTSVDASSSDDNKVASEDETLPASRITPDHLKTYLAPRTKTQSAFVGEKRIPIPRRYSHIGSPYVRTLESDGDNAISSKVSAESNSSHSSDTPWPLILNTFTVGDKKIKHLTTKHRRHSCDIRSTQRFENMDMEEMQEVNSDDGDGEEDIDDNDDEVYHSLPSTASSSRTSMGRVIFSQTLSTEAKQSTEPNVDNVQIGLRSAFEKSVNPDYNPDKGGFKPENKRINEDHAMQLRTNIDERVNKPVKKQVKFNDKPIGPTRPLPLNDVTKLPIKPAIQLNKMQCRNQQCNNQHCYNQHNTNQHFTTNQHDCNQHDYNQHDYNQHDYNQPYYNQQSILSSSPQPRYASPSSSTSSTSDSLKQMAQQEHINAITTLFSGYKINKPPPQVNKIGLPQLNEPAITEPKPKPTHMSRRMSTSLDTWRNVTNSSPSLCSSPPPRTHSASPESLREDSPVFIAAELAEDPKLRKKCQVLIVENKEIKRKEAAFINELLEKQREMQRQRALKRQEFQNISKQKTITNIPMTTDNIEVQQKEDLVSEQSSTNALEQDKPQEEVIKEQEQEQGQSLPSLKRKRILVKEKKSKHKEKANSKRNTARIPNEPSGSNKIENVLEKKDEGAVVLTVQSVNKLDEIIVENIEKENKTLQKSKISLRVRTGTPVYDGGVNKSKAKAKVAQSAVTGKKVKTTKTVSVDNLIVEKLRSSNRTSNKNDMQMCDNEIEKSSETVATELTQSSIEKSNSTPPQQSTTDAAFKEVSTEYVSEKLELSKSAAPAPVIFELRTINVRNTRSLTPTQRVNEESHKQAEVNEPLVKDTSFSFPSPIPSRTGLVHLPSATSTPNTSTSRIRHGRIEVRRSMQDPSSNTELPLSATSWLLNVSPHRLTKTVKVRLKRLQELDMNSAAATSSTEKNNKDRLRSASALPFTFSEQDKPNEKYEGHEKNEKHEKREMHKKLETNEKRPIVASTFAPNVQSILTSIKADLDQTRRVEFLKQRLKAQLLEMDEKFGGNVKEVIERVLEKAAPMPVDDNLSTLAPTEEQTTKPKPIRRRASRKQATPSKKIRVPAERVVNFIEKGYKNKFDFTINEYVNENCKLNTNSVDVAEEEAISNEKNDAETQFNDSNQNQIETEIPIQISLNENINTKTLEEQQKSPNTDLKTCEPQQIPGDATHEQTPKDSNKVEDDEASVNQTVAIVRKEVIPNIPTHIDSGNIIESKLRTRHTHGAIVTQVVDVTPGRSANDNIFTDLLLKASKSATTATTTEVEAGSEVEAGAEAEFGPRVEADAKAGAEPEAEAGAVDETEAEAEFRAEAKIVAGAEVEVSNTVEEKQGEYAVANVDAITAESRLSSSTPSQVAAADMPCINDETETNTDNSNHMEIYNEMAAAAESLTMMANKYSKIKTKESSNRKTFNELHNNDNDMLPAADIILSKVLPCETITPQTQNNTAETCAIRPIANNGDDDDSNAIQQSNFNPTTAANPSGYSNALLEDITPYSSANEDTSSDCFLSQLAKKGKTSAETAVHGLNDTAAITTTTATMISLAATLTMQPSLLSGESRNELLSTAADVAATTPPTRLLSIGDVLSAKVGEQQNSMPTPTLTFFDSLQKEGSLAPISSETTNATVCDAAIKSSSTSEPVVFGIMQQADQMYVKPTPPPPLTPASVPIATTGEGEEEEGVGTKCDECSLKRSLPPPPPLLKKHQRFEEEVTYPSPINATATSDYEVTSTQGQIDTKSPDFNTFSMPTDVSEKAAMVVQNSQIDTTHHFEEKWHSLRRRTRKLTDDFLIRESLSNPLNKTIMRQRRMTFCSESALHVHFAPNTIFTTNDGNNLRDSESTATIATYGVLKSDFDGSGDTLPSTTTESVPVMKKNRRNKTNKKSKNSQTQRNRKSNSVSELNGTFVFGCSRLQPQNTDRSDVEGCVVIPASAVVPPVNLSNIGEAYSSSNTSSPIKIFVPPLDEIKEKKGRKKAVKALQITDGCEPKTKGRRGRPPGSKNKMLQTQEQVEVAKELEANKTAENLSKAIQQRGAKKRSISDVMPETEHSHHPECKPQPQLAETPEMPPPSPQQQTQKIQPKAAKLKKLSLDEMTPPDITKTTTAAAVMVAAGTTKVMTERSDRATGRRKK